jgi:Glycosyl transferase 4-like domain
VHHVHRVRTVTIERLNPPGDPRDAIQHPHGASTPRSGDLHGAPPVIVQAVTSLQVGGAEQMVSLLARALHERDMRVRVLALGDGPLRAPLERAGIPCDVLPIPSKWDVPAFRRVRAYLEQHRADVVHTHCARTRLFVGMQARRDRMRVPAVVTTFHALCPSKATS